MLETNVRYNEDEWKERIGVNWPPGHPPPSSCSFPHWTTLRSHFLLSAQQPFYSVSSSHHFLLKECIAGRKVGRETKANIAGGGSEMLGPTVDTSIHRLDRVSGGQTAFPELLTSATFLLAAKLF